jgi:C-terminal processing protease CtpA/Prc
VVLIDQDTRGAAEVLAATLRDNAKAMLVGSQTAGAAVEFEEFLVGAGRSVRVAVAQALVPKSGALFPKGVAPDIAVRLDRETRDKIFDQTTKDGATQFAFDVEPPRMNEAALVANTNPEITEDSREKASPALRDTVLQRAVDLVTAIAFYKK